MSDYESVQLVKNEVFVYKIPPRTANRGHRAENWDLSNPIWVGRVKVVAKGNDLFVKLEDKNTGELFAMTKVDAFPGQVVEQVMDSSRYFVLRIEDGGGRHAFIGMGFGDRGDSFDFQVSLQDHFRWLTTSKEAEQQMEQLKQQGPSVDYSLKEGQTIRISLGKPKEGQAAPASRPRPAATGNTGAVPFLPPPPGPGRIAPPPTSGATSSPGRPSGNAPAPAQAQSGLGDLDPFGFGSFGSQQQQQNPPPANTNNWF
eukprot:Opistho-1_new@90131